MIKKMNEKMSENLILEIGTEELPPSCIDEGILDFKKILEDNFKDTGIKYNEVKTFTSPRRIVSFITGIENKQETREKIISGPPVSISYDNSGNPTNAAIGFARSLNLEVSELDKIEIEGKGVYLGKKIFEEVKPVTEILPLVLKKSIGSITFKKQMTWGDYDFRFARPIRWILSILGNKIIEFNIENINSSNITYGHRVLGSPQIKISTADNYFEDLEKYGKVIVDSSKRRSIILDSIKRLEESWNNEFKVIINENLLKDVVNLVEMPNVIEGDFPQNYLYIPKDILIEAIQYHQKYFAVIDRNENVSTRFVIVQNGLQDKGSIQKGNQRVLRARLADASFFYEEDKKSSFQQWSEKLSGLIFYAGLGSMKEKSSRIKEISLHILDKLKDNNRTAIKNFEGMSLNLSKASAYCKCDLVTNMVVEFPELQGIVGREYAQEKGENAEVYSALFEHYLPRFANDILPLTQTGLILSIADKIDSITGMFMIGNVPSGSEDPFALRRKALGIVLSILKGGYDLELKELIKFASDLYRNEFPGKNFKNNNAENDIFEFIIARYRFMLEKEEKRMDFLEAILGSGQSSLIDIDLRYKPLEDYIAEKDINILTAPMIRSKNIIIKKQFNKVNASLFIDDNEKLLFNKLSELTKESDSLIKQKKYSDLIDKFESFGNTVNTFFDRVLVMDKDEKVRANRVNLIKEVVDAYLCFADFSKIIS